MVDSNGNTILCIPDGIGCVMSLLYVWLSNATSCCVKQVYCAVKLMCIMAHIAWIAILQFKHGDRIQVVHILNSN